MDKLLIFAGTYEGRVLCEFLNDNKVKATASVATEYGEEIISNLEFVNVIRGRLECEAIENLIKKNGYSKIIDATHPYATLVSENIKKACKTEKCQYIRLLREEGACEDVIKVEDIQQAVYMLNNLDGNIMLTTGSKDLAKYVTVKDFTKRVFARVLPSKEVLKSCESLGIKGRNLICMQGPFSKELNIAMLRDYNCSILVTKNTGIAGGFLEKIQAANFVGAKVIVIDRPTNESESDSFTQNLEEIKSSLVPKNKNLALPIEKANIDLSKRNEQEDKFKYFPVFVDSVDKMVVIVGAGKIGLKRAEKLKNFGFEIKIIGKEFLYKPTKVVSKEKSFEDKDIDGAFLVIAATDSKDVNNHISKLCKSQGILCSVANKGSEGSFIFPAIIKNQQNLIAVSSDGTNPTATKELAKKLRKVLSLNLEV